MRIAVNTRLLLPNKLEGIGWFTHESLGRITRAHPEHRFIYLFDRKFDERFIHGPNVEPVVIPPPTRHPLLYRIWFDHMVPGALRKHKADLFLSPDGILSLLTEVPQVPVIHDLNFEHHPEDLPKVYSRYYRSHFPRFAKKAARIVTVSQFSKDDIVKQYDVAPGKIDVVYNGVGDVFTPLNANARDEGRTKFTDGAPYFVCVGAMHKRKNLANLLAAFDRFADERAGVKLLFVGERMFKDEGMERAWNAMRHKDRVVFAGRLGQGDLRVAVGSSLALVFVSYFEGFGIPVVEAMKCGVPVIAANATSLPEVAGDAAIYCDPFNVADIAQAMQRMNDDAALRDRLSNAGMERAARFTWDRTATDLWASLQMVMNNLPRS